LILSTAYSDRGQKPEVDLFKGKKNCILTNTGRSDVHIHLTGTPTNQIASSVSHPIERLDSEVMSWFYFTSQITNTDQ